MSKFNATKKRHVFTTAAAKLAVKFAAAPAAPAEGEAAEPGEWAATLTGYAIMWDTLSDDRGGYRVKLAPGSAKFAVPTLALWHHSYAQPIGNTANGSLRLIPDEVGVRVEIDLPDTTTGRDVAELVGDGYVAGMSFAMAEVLEFTENDEGEETIVTFTNYLVDEVTVTPIPAFADTSIQVKGGGEGNEGDGDYAKSLAADAVRLDQKKLAMYSLR
jgi:HK97 family phage prohead protease